MGTIKTNYTRDAKLVLVNDENSVVAIINVPKGADITEQVKLAIKEELCASDVVFEKDFSNGEFQSTIEIDFIYNDGEDEEFTKRFELVKTAEY